MSTSNRPGTIVWTDLTVANADELSEYYHHVLGWKPLGEDMGGYNDYHMIPEGNDTPVAGVCHARGTNANVPPQWLIYVAVEDVHEAARRCEEKGGTVVDGPRKMGSGDFAVLRDPAGAVVAVFKG